MKLYIWEYEWGFSWLNLITKLRAEQICTQQKVEKEEEQEKKLRTETVSANMRNFSCIFGIFLPESFKKLCQKSFWDVFAYFFCFAAPFLLPPPLQETNGFSYLLCDSPPFCMVLQTHPSFPHGTKWVSFSPFLLCFLAFFLSSPSFLCVGSALNGKGLFFLFFFLLPKRDRGGEREEKGGEEEEKDREGERRERNRSLTVFPKGTNFSKPIKREKLHHRQGWI